MAKKIGICCVYDVRNYGSMLQSLATLKKLEQLGVDYEIIRYTKKLTLGLLLRSIGRIPEEIKLRLENRKGRVEMEKHPEIAAGIQARNQCFDSFMQERFTKLSQPYDSMQELREASRNYQAVLVGSDQLWVPRGYSTGFFNLMFVADGIPKLAYATSFGVSQIPKNKRKAAVRFLNRMDHISVRELRASEMIEELTGRKVPTVVDPTLLFTGEEWKNVISVKPVVQEEKYIFCYFLGNNPSQREEVRELSQETGLPIVFIPHLDEYIESDNDFGDIRLYKAGPAEFVNLIRHATYVCTDSFHGTVFSILNHKQFITFNRFHTDDVNSRNSRIDSLLTQTELQCRRFRGNLLTNLNEPIDYSAVENRLTQMRSKSVNYLNTALDSVKYRER